MGESSHAAETQAAGIAVVLATRNRPVAAELAAASVLSSLYRCFELLVVDQSTNDATSRALASLAGDRRLTVLRSATLGLARARNLGVVATKAPIVAFTDDDCEVAPGWLDAIVSALAADSRIGVVFGDVHAVDYDRTAGFVPAYRVKQTFTARGLRDKARIEGIGACMAVRRATWEALEGFDELFGAGAPYRSGEDSDFTMRALLKGHWAHETAAAVVRHSGFRPWHEGPALIDGYMLGLGAANTKMLRLGGLAALKPIGDLAWRWLADEPVVDLNHRPPRLRRLGAFLSGAWLAWREPLNRSSGRFLRPEALKELG